ncbi:MAG: Fic family protein [Blastocatellia bacterium]
MRTGQHWKPIEDLPDHWLKLASSELAGLLEVWKEQAERLKDSPSYREFEARLRREWAIETGIIEGLYDIDRGVTRTLIEQGLDAGLIAHGDANKPAEEIIPMLKDHETVIEGLFDFVGQKRALSTSYIKQVHQALTAHQETAKGIDTLGRTIQTPLLRGDWKKRPNNPTQPDGLIYEYCPPEQVASEMDRLIEMHSQHLENGVPPEVEAAWLHHRFTQIHPFQDGNGRVARALASLVFLRGRAFPLVVHRDDRGDYIDCLERADTGKLSPFVSLLSKLQKKAFNQAMNIAQAILLPADSAEQIIAAGARLVREKNQIESVVLKERRRLYELYRNVAESLLRVTRERLGTIAQSFQEEFPSPDQASPVSIQGNDQHRPLGPSSFHQVSAGIIARELGYPTDNSPDGWGVSMIIGVRYPATNIHLSLCNLTNSNWKIMSAFAYSTTDPSHQPHPLCEEPFQCSTSENGEAIHSRFKQWLEDALIVGLEQWRRSL